MVNGEWTTQLTIAGFENQWVHHGPVPCMVKPHVHRRVENVPNYYADMTEFHLIDLVCIS